MKRYQIREMVDGGFRGRGEVVRVIELPDEAEAPEGAELLPVVPDPGPSPAPSA